MTITATAQGVKYVADTAEENNTYTYVLTNAGQYSNVSASTGSLSITKAPLTITADSATKEYDGDPLTDDGWQDTAPEGLKGTDAVESVTVTGTITEVGTEDNVASGAVVKNGDTDVTANYEITYVNGTLKVTRATLPKDPDDPDDPAAQRFSVSGPEDTLYNGKEQRQPVTITDNKTGTALVPGVDVELKYSDDVTNAGDVTVTITGIGNYEGTFTRTYKINPRTVVLTSEGAEKEYDGTPLTNSNVTVSGDGFVEGEGATYNVTGSQTEAGESKNTFTYELKEGTLAGNYDISTEEGTLKVTRATLPEDPDDPDDPAAQRFSVSGPEDTVYNGLEQRQPIVITDNKTGKELVEGVDFELTYSDDVTNAGKVTVTVKGIGSYDGEFIRTYNIIPAQLVITTPSATKVADGTALTAPNATIEGLVNGEIATVTATGSQTAVGSSQNGYNITWDTAKASNYTITENLGTLTVTAAPVPEVVPVPPVVPPVPPAPPEDIEPPIPPRGDPEPPTEPPTEDIVDPEPPLTPGEPTWALINLLLAAFTTILGAVMMILYFHKKKDDEDDNESDNKEEDEKARKRHLILRIVTCVLAVASIVVFILTEDMSLKMALVDKWTILMGVLAVAGIVTSIFSRKTKNNDEDEASVNPEN